MSIKTNLEKAVMLRSANTADQTKCDVTWFSAIIRKTYIPKRHSTIVTRKPNIKLIYKLNIFTFITQNDIKSKHEKNDKYNRVQYHATDCTAFVCTRADLLPTTKCRKIGKKNRKFKIQSKEMKYWARRRRNCKYIGKQTRQNNEEIMSHDVR